MTHLLILPDKCELFVIKMQPIVGFQLKFQFSILRMHECYFNAVTFACPDHRIVSIAFLMIFPLEQSFAYGQ